jgi:hypothetical protein
VQGVPQHPVVVKGDIGELRPTIDVTDCVHSVNIGAQLIVDGNVAPLIGGHPGGGQIEILGCWASACCHQHRVGGECLIVGDDVDMVTCFIAGGHLRSGDDGDPFTLKHVAHTLGDVGVKGGDEGLAGLEQGHLGAESGEHLGELQPDEPAAYDDELRRQGVDVLDRGGVMDSRAIGSGNRKVGWVRSGVDDDRLRSHGDLIVSRDHLDSVRPSEAGYPVEEEHFALQHGMVGAVQCGDEGVSVGDG